MDVNHQFVNTAFTLLASRVTSAKIMQCHGSQGQYLSRFFFLKNSGLIWRVMGLEWDSSSFPSALIPIGYRWCFSLFFGVKMEVLIACWFFGLLIIF